MQVKYDRDWRAWQHVNEHLTRIKHCSINHSSAMILYLQIRLYKTASIIYGHIYAYIYIFIYSSYLFDLSFTPYSWILYIYNRGHAELRWEETRQSPGELNPRLIASCYKTFPRPPMYVLRGLFICEVICFFFCHLSGWFIFHSQMCKVVCIYP